MFLQSNLDKLKARKKELKLTNQELSEKSGVPLGTINKIFSGATIYPRRATVEALAVAMDPLVRAMDLDYFKIKSYEESTPVIRGASAAYGFSAMEDGRATLEDYYALPPDRRAELIDGEIIEMSAPSANHQLVLLELAVLIRKYLDKVDSKCRVFIAPYDVQLDRDEFTMVQPDVMIICDKDKYENGKHCYGPPDFIIEIVSPSNPEHDYFLKSYKYCEAGVGEYWIVDLIKKRVLVYAFETDEIPTIYTFNDLVKSKLFSGLEIDFGAIESILV